MKIQIAGAAVTKFGEHWNKTLLDLTTEVSVEAMKDAAVTLKNIEAVFVGNMLSGTLQEQEHLGAVVASQLGINKSAFKIEGACASGGLAVHLAMQSLLAGTYETVLVVGVEKMTDFPPDEISSLLMRAGSEEERVAGLTFPALYALLAKAHMQAFGTTREHMAQVAVKNHYHASLNAKAQFPFEISIEKVLNSSKVTDPFTLLDSSPITDGAAALVLTAKKSSQKKKISIIASAVATDTIAISDRVSLTELAATKHAAKKAFSLAGVSPKDIDVLEVHDCFTIAEILAMEDLGFCKKGEGGALSQVEQHDLVEKNQ